MKSKTDKNRAEKIQWSVTPTNEKHEMPIRIEVAGTQAEVEERARTIIRELERVFGMSSFGCNIEGTSSTGAFIQLEINE